jgi:sulfite reductase (ferredoxin)
LDTDFETFIYQLNQNEASEEFAAKYLADAEKFYTLVDQYRDQELVEA